MPYSIHRNERHANPFGSKDLRQGTACTRRTFRWEVLHRGIYHSHLLQACVSIAHLEGRKCLLLCQRGFGIRGGVSTVFALQARGIAGNTRMGWNENNGGTRAAAVE